MAARLRTNHQDDVRAKIQASQLINRLQGHANGEVDMTVSQIQAAKILLDKSLGNAPQQLQLAGHDGEALVVKLESADGEA